MSRNRYCEVTCDVRLSPDCYEEGPVEYTIGQAVKHARADGWKVGPVGAERDTCPTCWIAVQMERRHGSMRPGSNRMQS